MDELSMCIWGKTFWAIEKDPGGRPREIWWMKGSRVRPVPDSKKYLRGFLYESTLGGQDIRFEPDEVVWFRYPHPLDEYGSLSPIVAARLAADTSSAMMRSNRALHDQGLQIAGIVAPRDKRIQFTPEQATQLESDLQRRFAGADKAHRWAVLRYEAEFKPVNISPKDAEFVNGLGLTGRMIYNAFGVPSALLNDLEHATLANVRELQTALWEHALVPDLGLRAGDIREQFLPMFGRHGVETADHCAFDFGGVTALQKALSETWDRDRQAMDSGALTINEWRRRQGMPPVPWGDVWWAPVNKSAVTDASSRPQGDTSPTKVPAERADEGDVVDGEVVQEQQLRGMRRLLAELERGGSA
jgi:HK97 family phage portal protein